MLSTIAWIAILFILITIKFVFVQPLEDRRIYSLYAARDEVAIGAIQNEIDQESKIYNFVMDYLNFWLFYSKNDYDFSIFLNNLIELEPEDVEQIQERLNEELAGNLIARNAMRKAEPHVKWVIGVKAFVFVHVFLAGIVAVATVLLKTVEFIISLWDKGYTTAKRLSEIIDESNRLRVEYNSTRNMIYKRMI